jgi:hypothetical protein
VASFSRSPESRGERRPSPAYRRHETFRLWRFPRWRRRIA